MIKSQLGSRHKKLWASFSHLCASCHQVVQVGTALRAVTPDGWEVTVDLVESNGSLPPGS